MFNSLPTFLTNPLILNMSNLLVNRSLGKTTKSLPDNKMDSSTLIGLIALVLVFLLGGLIPFYADRNDRYSHGLRNLSLALAAGVIGILMTPLVLWSVRLAARHDLGLCNLIAIYPVACGLLTFVLFDLWMYVWRRMNHQLPFLWRFHQVHHTDPALDSTTALRFHPVEVLISTALNCVLMIALGMSLEVFALYKSVMVVVILFHHSNLRISPHLDSWLRWVIVPPSLHRVHHSNLRWETDSDYGTIFSFWDQLFGSYRTRHTYHDIRFGIGRYDSPDWQRPLRLLVLPLRPLAPGDK